MRRMLRSIAAAALLILMASSSPALAADGRPAVAPPGLCAEPRAAAADARAEAYPVAGPLSSLFDPVDVAAGPVESGPRRPGPPSARALVRPGACDQPGSGCGPSPVRTRVIEVPPVTPGVPPPGAFRPAQ
jgi:hypothetical protein